MTGSEVLSQLIFTIGQLIFVIWALFMLGGTVIVLTAMMWKVLSDIYKGEW